MKPIGNKLTTLKTELDFVNRGGYRKAVIARQPLFCMETAAAPEPRTFFEDSPVCPKERHAACDPASSCVLMSFVPEGHRGDVLPCHHIPLNDRGDTIATLEKNGNRAETETAIREWVARNVELAEAERK